MGNAENNDEGKLNEPLAPYRNNTIRVFPSFEAAGDYELANTLSQTPEERIKETVQLILRVYGVTQEQLNTRARVNKITIIKAG